MSERQGLYRYRAFVDRVVDGDTVDLRVDLGFYVWINIRTRLLGINAPELSTEEGKVSRQMLRARLPVGQEVIVETGKSAGDKFGRWLATIYKDNEDVNRWMVDNGHAQVIT